MPRPKFDTHFHCFVQQDISVIKVINNYHKPTDISIDAPMVAIIKQLRDLSVVSVGLLIFILCARNMLNMPLTSLTLINRIFSP